jgi:hypothetical protein
MVLFRHSVDKVLEIISRLFHFHRRFDFVFHTSYTYTKYNKYGQGSKSIVGDIDFQNKKEKERFRSKTQFQYVEVGTRVTSYDYAGYSLQHPTSNNSIPICK